MKALIVDDEPPARRELRRLLGAIQGIDIVGEAGNIDDARERIESLEPDVVFLDIHLPSGTGFDLLAQLSDGPGGNTEVVARVVADLETVRVQFFDLFPRHVIHLVRAKRKALSDKERGAKTVTFQNGPHHRVMGRDRIVEREHNQSVRERLKRKRPCRYQTEKHKGHRP